MHKRRLRSLQIPRPGVLGRKVGQAAFSVFSVSLFKTFLLFLETPHFLLLAAVAWGRVDLLGALWPECVPLPLLTFFNRKETSVKRSASDSFSVC